MKKFTVSYTCLSEDEKVMGTPKVMADSVTVNAGTIKEAVEKGQAYGYAMSLNGFELTAVNQVTAQY